MAVLKADAYGHGVEGMARFYSQKKIKHFCVASLEEAVELRRIAPKAHILVLGGTLHWNSESFEKVRKYHLKVAINSVSALRFFLKRPEVPLHLKFDTGMNRLGLKEDEWTDALILVKRSKRQIDGLFTHFANFDGPSFRRQVMLFEEIVRWYESEGVRAKWIHSENSAALFASTQGLKKGILSERANLVRPGISLLGYMPSNFKRKQNLKPVLQLVAEVGLVKTAEKAEGISYDFLYRAKKRHSYGVVSLGYADGLAKSYAPVIRPVSLHKNGTKKADLLVCGSVCMDMVMLRPARGKIDVGDRVVFWGRPKDALIASKSADPYELNLRIAKRIPRIWVP